MALAEKEKVRFRHKEIIKNVVVSVMRRYCKIRLFYLEEDSNTVKKHKGETIKRCYAVSRSVTRYYCKMHLFCMMWVYSCTVSRLPMVSNSG